MELQEDAYRLQQVLENLDPKDIIKFLRTQVSLADTEIRCELALQHFIKLEALIKRGETYENDMRADFLCIRHLLSSVSDEEIQEMLDLLGPIPNRKYIAIKLLLRQSSQSSTKKRKSNILQNDICEASSNKQVKLSDSDKPLETHTNGIEHLELTDQVIGQREPLKLTIRSIKDRDGNDKFMVTSPSKTGSEAFSPNIEIKEPPDITRTTSEVIDISEQDEKNECLPSSSVSVILSTARQQLSAKNVYNDLPSTSNLLRKQSLRHNVHELTQPPPDVPTSNSGQAIDLTLNEIQAFKDKIGNLPQSADGEIDHSKRPKYVDEKLVLKLIEMFPDASSNYIRDICEGKEWSEQNFDEIVTVILSTDEYPRRPERQPSPPKEVDPQEQLNMLKSILDDADPSYLEEKIVQLAGDEEGLNEFIEDALKNKNYPTLKDYLRKQQVSAQQRQYTTEFNVERFVELFPDPVATFEDTNRKTVILDQSDKSYVKWFMRNTYNQLYVKDVNTIVESEGIKNIISIVKALDALVAKGIIKKSRWVSHLRPDTQNIPLLQELAYFEHKAEIYEYVETKKRKAAEECQNAKDLGLLQSCSCCYDEEVMPNDILTCTGGCRFCKDCIKKGTEVAFGEGKIEFPCLMACGAEFSLPVLQNVLPPKVFSKLAQKKAVAEVKAAGIEELETCPFCDFATIPAPDDKLFRCLNPDCMKESCRSCKEPSHVPLRCSEVEKDEAVKARTYIEDKMTEALIRQCWKCNAKFVKDEGCNKMTCSCGAMMCYVCREPVKDYKHFNGQGGDRYDLCPLYTDNFLVNEKNVLKAAEEAKKQVNPAQLKNDPTADLQKHFGKKIKEAEQRQRHRQAGAHVHGLRLDQMQQVQRLRRELREQLMMIQDLGIHDRFQILDQFIPQHRGVGHRHQQNPPPPPPPQPQEFRLARIDQIDAALLQIPPPPADFIPHNPDIARALIPDVAPAANEQQQANIQYADHVNDYAMGQ